MLRLTKERTMRIRHLAVKLLAPKLFQEHSPLSQVNFPRPMIQFVRDNIDKSDLVGFEIGVASGFHAKSILETLPIEMLYLIDPYRPYSEMVHGKRVRVSYANSFKHAKTRLSRFADKITFIKMKSEDAVSKLKHFRFHFGYIDGNHDFNYVLKDLVLYYPLIVSGGVLGGHDFESKWLGVCKAVMEFASQRNLELYGDQTDWWFVK